MDSNSSKIQLGIFVGVFNKNQLTLAASNACLHVFPCALSLLVINTDNSKKDVTSVITVINKFGLIAHIGRNHS